MNNNTVKNTTVKGLAWSFTELIAKQGIQLVIQIILARLLVPEHFGLIGMITIFIALSNSIVQSGMDQALIREKNPTQTDYSTVFFFNLFVAVCIYLILFVSAPTISNFFNEPQLIEIIRVLMIIVIINAVGVIQRVILIRKVDFKTQTKISIIAGLCSGVIAIILALTGFGVWSLVVQTIMMQLVQVIFLYINYRWKPSLNFSISAFKNFFNFGYKLLLSGLIDTTYKNIYFVIIGKLYPAAHLGYYTNASKFRDVASQSITQAIQKVTYPVLSSIKEDEERLSYSYKKLIKITAFLYFPFMLGLAVTSSNFIPLLLGEQWLPSVLYFQLLSVAGMLYPIHSINLNILKVKGRSDLFLKLEIIKKSVLSLLILFAVLLETGIVGLIGAAIINSFISLFINMHYSGREISYSFLKQIKDLLPIFFSSIVMSLIIHFVSSYLFGIYFIDLLIEILIGIVTYIIVSKLIKVDAFNDVYKVISKFIGEKVKLYKENKT